MKSAIRIAIVVCLATACINAPLDAFQKGAGQAGDRPAGQKAAKPAPQLEKVIARLQPLMKKYYPRGKISFQRGSVVFEYNTRQFYIHERRLTGEWQDAFRTNGPQHGGILGTIEFRRGPYMGMAVVPQTFDKRYFKHLLMAPHSRKEGGHLYVHLKYPSNVSKPFFGEFVRMIEDFGDQRGK